MTLTVIGAGFGRTGTLSLKLALEELAFFSSHVKVLGVYPAHPFRVTNKGSG